MSPERRIERLTSPSHRHAVSHVDQVKVTLADNRSFEGWVMPRRTGDYTFATHCSRQVRRWVNDRQLIDAWSDQSGPGHEGSIHLKAGQPAKIRLDFYNRRRNAFIRLLRAPPGTNSPPRVFDTEYLPES